jgi:hypothetical protein
MYVAKRPLKVGETTVGIGEPVPDAESWLRRESWERFGYIKWVDDPQPTKKTAAKVQRRT